MADLLAELNQQRQPVNLLAELQQSQPQEPTIGERVVGGIEGAAALGSSIISQPIAGLAGIARGLNPYAEEGSSNTASKGHY